MQFWRLLAHNHWLTLNIIGYDVRLCARCSGYVLGFVVPFMIFKTRGIESFVLQGFTWQLVCFFLALPLTFDWVTQSWGLRRSRNSVRLSTGILFGLDLFVYSLLGVGMETKKLVFVATILAVVLVGRIGKNRVQLLD